MAEFSIIEKYFKREHRRNDVVLGSGDDAALLKPPNNQLLATSIDAVVSGMHFLENTDPAHIAYKSVAISLSDIAAMGAEPAWLVATLSMPSVDESWLAKFSDGFYELIEQHNLALVGGDIVQGPLAINTQVTGFVPEGQALRRSGAKPGDKIYVTGTLGGATHALYCLQANKIAPQLLLERLHRPTPRVKEGLSLRGIASSAIDISDGLLADLGHILDASKVGARIDINAVPVPDSIVTQPFTLSAGDDYELCFTLPPEKQAELSTEFDFSCIGEITEEAGIQVFDHGKMIAIEHHGFQHFS